MTPAPFHVAVSMDGNGRWASRRGLPRTIGHREGVKAVRRIVEAAPQHGVTTLTLFAFAANNWRRPREEVDGLMGLLDAYLRSDAERFIESGARLSLIGRRDRLPPRLVEAIARIERASAGGDMHLRIAIDYSSREAIVRAATACGSAAPSLDDFSRLVAGSDDAGTVDLMIRTGGEKRLSDFLLWECAYAELWFTDTLWPDFSEAEFAEAIADFRRRERRFGAIAAA
ncbi:MAG TPA: polyprenyl diphosphate synthase [Caulobacteraceae bacterium]|jgi:undecaprenyl diphosphate synthase|nr:polyprenyl diphosphate synthase [Caulobacteraceae bacterium]